MPSKHQHGTEREYKTQTHRQVDLWPDEWLLLMKPVNLEIAQECLAAANAQDASKEVKEHFYQQIQRLKG